MSKKPIIEIADLNLPGLDLPRDALQLMYMIREYLRTQVDHGTSMDTGGGFGCADLWVTFDGKEYTITVKGGGSDKARADRLEEINLTRDIIARGMDQAKADYNRSQVAFFKRTLQAILLSQTLDEAKKHAEEALDPQTDKEQK